VETYHFNMTPAQTKLARWAGRTAVKHLTGAKLYEGIKIGEALLIGRAAAMKASGANTTRDKGYALAFKQWKRQFKFPDDDSIPGAARFYTDAILIAEQRELANELIVKMGSERKAEMGVAGLAKLIVMNLKAKREHDADPNKKKDKFKVSFGPWETKRERQLRKQLDELWHERLEWIEANRALLAGLTPLIAALDPSTRAEIDLVLDLWRHSWGETTRAEAEPADVPY
jgi:hypothetical protein